jgi:VanZ family protein
VKSFVKYQFPLIIWAAVIFWLSSLNSLPPIETPIISADKLAHISVYFIFYWLSYRAIFFQTFSIRLKRWSLVWALLLTGIYGYLDELHQSFVPGRKYDYYDMLADLIGGLLFITLFLILKRGKEKKKL